MHQDSWYISLLGLAESFRTSNPPNIKLCIHCLQTIFNFKPPPRIEARTHLQLGIVLFTHTKNIDLAREHLEKAVNILHSDHLQCLFGLCSTQMFILNVFVFILGPSNDFVTHKLICNFVVFFSGLELKLYP